MLCAIADTHTVIWYLYGDQRLSSTAKEFIEGAVKNGNQVGVSAITLAEIVYLIEKDKIAKDAFERLMSALESPDSVLVETPFTGQIAQKMLLINRKSVPDFPDRTIAATSIYFNVPVISRDGKI
jgi:PIN domain nuclease of toxin-antitoxin system